VLPAPEDAMEFVSLMVATPEPAAEPPLAGGSVEIAVGAVTVRLEPGASAEGSPPWCGRWHDPVGPGADPDRDEARGFPQEP
ncbi:hypothetical protein, partial [Poseidonocella sp. HB161398]|uniref:hypothetical protein n=1 Tax=Poseidonocella sp. HB161398 TaxID=2320855 RepID=UPI00351512B9